MLLAVCSLTSAWRNGDGALRTRILVDGVPTPFANEDGAQLGHAPEEFLALHANELRGEIKPRACEPRGVDAATSCWPSPARPGHREGSSTPPPACDPGCTPRGRTGARSPTTCPSV